MARNMGHKLAIFGIMLFVLSSHLSSAFPVMEVANWGPAAQVAAGSSSLANFLVGARHEQPIVKRTDHHGSHPVQVSHDNATARSLHKAFNSSHTAFGPSHKAFNTSTWANVTSKTSKVSNTSKWANVTSSKASNGTFQASTWRNVASKAKNGTFKASTWRNVTSKATNSTFQASTWRNATSKGNKAPFKVPSHQSGPASLHKVPSGSGAESLPKVPSASGQAVGGLHNACPFPVHYSLVHPAVQAEAMPDLDVSPTFSALAQGQSVTHPFSHDPMGGVVWKVKQAASDDAIIQFEHTWNKHENRVYYDISWVDGHDAVGVPVFATNGVNVQLFGGAAGAGGTHGHGNCKPLVCPAGDMHCDQAYHNPKDDWATHACDDDTSLVMVLCPGAGAGGADVAPKLERRMEMLDLQNVLAGESPVSDSGSAREASFSLEKVLWIVGTALIVTGMGFSAL